MSPESPNVYQASFIRKSLAAVSEIRNVSPINNSANRPMRKPILQSHRIFNLSLARLATSFPPRQGPKTPYGPPKHSNLHSLGDPDGSTSVDEDDSMYNEQNSLETDNSATYLTSTAPAPPRLLAPPGLNLPPPPRYPIIVPMKKNAVPELGAAPPSHWAPGGGCDVRIEPEPPMRFQPRPGSNPPPYWNPGGRATRLDKPVCDLEDPLLHIQSYGSNGSSVSSESDPSLDQDVTDGTISTSVSSASWHSAMEQDEGMQNAPPSKKDHIQAQLEHILDMEDALIDHADLPGVLQSVWATCPTVSL
ncbi:hypothetical protein B0H19DRAFT_54544 [Mycena capillaripes]|nr:hypothetical protein B0H19DRAFT_54544 [Mycena capillaripes]